MPGFVPVGAPARFMSSSPSAKRRGCTAWNSPAGHAPQCHVRDLAATPPMASIGVSAHKPVSQASGRLRRSTTGIGQGRRFDRRLAG